MELTNNLSTVDFIIPAESAQEVVKLLLFNKIVFTVAFLDSSETIQNEINLTKQKSADNMKSVSRQVKFETIYRKYIEENKEQVPPNGSQIATEFGMSLSKFNNGFKEIYGKPFYQLYIEKKMEYAQKLLLEGLVAVKVAQLVGYSHPIKFNKMFQKHFGMTPKEYQISHRR